MWQAAKKILFARLTRADIFASLAILISLYPLLHASDSVEFYFLQVHVEGGGQTVVLKYSLADTGNKTVVIESLGLKLDSVNITAHSSAPLDENSNFPISLKPDTKMSSVQLTAECANFPMDRPVRMMILFHLIGPESLDVSKEVELGFVVYRSSDGATLKEIPINPIKLK